MPRGRHVVFFETFDAMMPIINRERFWRDLAISPQSIQLRALSQAIATLGACAAPELGYAGDAHYTETRTLLETCERQDNVSDLDSMHMLQAFALLGFYELRMVNPARAWLTLGRGIRLGKVLGFMNPPGSTATNSEPRHVEVSLALNSEDAEEIQRTMWQLYILDAFAVMRTQWDPVIEEVR